MTTPAEAGRAPRWTGSGLACGRARPGRADSTHNDGMRTVGEGRGMVTAELAFAVLAALAMLVSLCSGIQLVVLQLRCQDTAAEVARQVARDDGRAAAAARAKAPTGAQVRVSRSSGLVRVEVRVVARPVGLGAVRVPLRARADVMPEPGRPR